MSSGAHDPGTGDLHDQAAAWLDRLRSPAAGEEDWLALEAWLADDPARLAAFEAAEMLWAELDEHREPIIAGLAPDLAPAANVVDLAARRPAAVRRRAPWAAWASIAATAVLVVGGAGLFLAMQPRTNAYATARGETRRLALEDGTRIDLNSGSRLSVRYDHKARRVEMGEAEAIFDVAKDPARPFFVAVGDRQVRVVGTRFNVLRHDGKVTITVARGVVEVSGGGAAAVRLTPGLQLFHREGEAGSVVRAVNADDAFAWRQGRLIYHDRPLAEVADDLTRILPQPVQVDGPARDLRFSGVLVVDDEAAVMRRLEAFLPVQAHRSDGTITLSSRR